MEVGETMKMITMNSMVFCRRASLLTAKGKSTATNVSDRSDSALYTPTTMRNKEASYLKQYCGVRGRKESNVLDSRAGRAMSSEAKLRHINISDCATLIYRWNRHL